MKVLKFLKLQKNAKLPQYALEGDAGFDLFSVEDATVKSGDYKLIHLGIASEIPAGYFVSIRGKSSLAGKHGIDVLGGVIDSGYRGEWMIILSNLSKENFHIEKGDKIAQGILQEAKQAKIVETKKLTETKRGVKGFGSTGKK